MNPTREDSRKYSESIWKSPMTSNPPPPKEGQAQTHTPTPWVRSSTHIYAPGENGANICTMGEPRASKLVGYTPIDIGSKDLKEAIANAEFILTAVNSHSSLLASHERLKQALEEYMAAEDQHTNAMLCAFDESLSDTAKKAVQNDANIRLSKSKRLARTALSTAHSVNNGS